MQPFAKAANGLGCRIRVERHDLGVVHHQPDRLAVMVLVEAWQMHDDGPVMDAEVADCAVEHSVDALEQ